MSLDCPNCGAHLTVSLADGRAATSAPAGEKPVPEAKKPLLPRVNPVLPTEADFHRLKQLMCAPLPASTPWKPTQPTMRPIVVSADPAHDDDDAAEVGLLKDPRARRTLILVTWEMYACLRAFGSDERETADTFLEARQRSYMARNPAMPARPMHNVLEAVGAIMYAMEWTGPVVDTGRLPQGAWPPADAGRMGRVKPGSLLYPKSGEGANFNYEIWRLLELMLLIDYGFPAPPIHTGLLRDSFLRLWSELESFADFLVGVARVWRWLQCLLSDDRTWDILTRATSRWSSLRLPVWDIATMLYYYRLHRNPDVEDHKQGRIGYTGVLQEMIAEVPTRGTDRLERKLSLDAHILIPRFVHGRELRKQMLLAVQDIAAKHGCHLAPPAMPKPPMWERLLNRISPRQAEKKCDESMKLLEDFEA